MIPLTFATVQEWTEGVAYHCSLERSVAGLTIDSRQVARDTLFVALPGTRTDGHAFVEAVWRAGGVALVRRNFWDWRGPQIRVDSPLAAMGRLLRRYLEAHGVTVVGVTGSVGKTSVKELITQVLRQRYATTASLGNYNTAIGLPLSFFAGEAGVTHFVAEMGMSGPGEIRRMTTIAPPSVAVISTIGPSHLERLGSMQAIQQAKGEILEGLKPDGVAILNGDNPWVRELGERCAKTVWWFGRAFAPDARVIDAFVEESATMIQVEVHGRMVKVRLPWVGVHHAENVAAALLAGEWLGVDLEEAARGLERISGQRSRIQIYQRGGITILEDVYNASPLSTKAALDVLASRRGRRLAVLGDMLELGSEEVAGHQEVGAYCRGRADLVLAVGPRARWIFEAAQASGVNTAWVERREEAWQWLQDAVKPGDAILLKASRGMHFEWLAERLREGVAP
ncbi:MAG: UDP-N-acetylmuramoyl-tripeptide--D-alanyl-D-alanine ligase [Firmicutes bacterium]|nr:UDP-N-acetylmuramoyl-tripeptide--D-alanyl-D-alanine ligase [Bacillota bacterium]